MRFKVAFLLCAVFLIHLQATAGELIKIVGVEKLDPIISVSLTADDQNKVAADIKSAAPSVLALYLMQDGHRAQLPVAGYYRLEGNTLTFNPYYGLGYSRSYEVVYHTGGKEYVKKFSTPQQPSSKQLSKVITAYPLTDTIPYNTLFFHIRFSQPMMDDKQAYQYVKVFDEDGVERQRVWRQKSFWLDDGKLLVLMIHPGRVKNGIHFESPLFDSGRHYTIKVDKDIKDVNGTPIASSYQKSYYVKGEDRVIPKATLAKTTYRLANTTSPVTLIFSEGMDHASVLAGTTLLNDDGQEVNFTITANSDKSYSIIPATLWKSGSYTIVLNGAVYDFAANRLNRLFEITDEKEIEKDKVKTKLHFNIQ